MKKKEMTAIIAALLFGFALTACGAAGSQPAQDTMTESNVQDENTPAGGQEEAAEKEPEHETAEEAPKAEQGEDEHESAGLLLGRYVSQLPMVDLDGITFRYEKFQEDDMIYFKTDGLKGLDHSVGEGCLQYHISDLDEDGAPELLAICLEKDGEEYGLGVKVYEAAGGQVREAASRTMISPFLGTQVDSADVRVMIKDGKYICADGSQYTYVSADGVWVDMNACYYNGESFVETANFGFAGSDWYGLGAESTELLDQLYTMKFDKAAAAVCDRDVFRFCDADEGTEALYKVEVTNSWEQEHGNREVPEAWVAQHKNTDYGQGYILAESNAKLLDAAQLKTMSKKNLRLARNEIYARYGWRFEDQELQKYFDEKVWYKPAENVDDSVLSDIERTNKELIAEAENNAEESFYALSEYLNLAGDKEELTPKELMEVSAFLDGMDAYGFTFSLYDDVRDVNLTEVFYCGAGIDNAGLDLDSVRRDYLAVVGDEELYTDLCVLREQDIDALLTEKTGYGLAEMRRPLGWVYLQKHQVYCMQAGDTNYMSPSVYDGVKTPDGTYYIEYGFESPFYGNEGESCILVLKKNGDGFQFVSNSLRR